MFNNIYKDKKVLITGNTGFKGSWLTCWLLKLGAKVFGYSSDIPSNPSLFEVLDLEKKIVHFKEDIRDYKSLRKTVLEIKPDFIFHLAAQALVSVSYSNPTATISTNVLGTTNILEVLRLLNAPCITILITSNKCYDNVEWGWGYRENDALGGKDIYSGSKGAAELVIKSYFHSFFKTNNSNIRISSARAGNVIGGGDWALDRIIPDCMRAWSKKNVVEIRSPNATRPWQHVLEPLSGYLLLGQKLAINSILNGESFNFGPPANYNHTVADILEDLKKFWSFNLENGFFKVSEEKKFHEAGLLKLNCDKALIQLGWESNLKYSETVSFTGEWYNRYYNSEENMFDYTKGQITDFENLARLKGLEWIT